MDIYTLRSALSYCSKAMPACLLAAMLLALMVFRERIPSSSRILIGAVCSMAKNGKLGRMTSEGQVILLLWFEREVLLGSCV